MWRFDKWDLKERVYNIVSKMIKLLEEKNKNEKRLVKNIYSQLYRSITSVWANLAESDVSITDKEFYRILGIVIRELKESQYWIRILRKEYNFKLEKEEIEILELIKIFSKLLQNRIK